MAKKKIGLFRREYLNTVEHLNKIKFITLIAFLIFLGIAIIGFVLPIIFQDHPVFFQEQIIELLKRIVDETQGKGPFELITYIMFNNMQSAFFATLFGMVLGIIPLGVLAVNGYVIGFVANKTVMAEGPFILWRLLPHGIFEIPAIMISIGLGLFLGLNQLKNLGVFYKDKKIKNKTRIVVLIIIPLALLFLQVLTILPFGFGMSELPSELSGMNLVELSIISIVLNTLVYYFVVSIIYTLMKKPLREELSDKISNTARVFVYVVIPLLIIAGIIEGLLIFFMGG